MKTLRIAPLERFHTAWLRVRPFLAASPRRILTLSLVSSISGLAEAGVLVLVLRIALATTTGERSVVIAALGSEVELQVGTLLFAGLGLCALRFGMQYIEAYLPPRMSVEAAVKIRKEMLGLYLEADWDLQAREREGHLQEVMSGQIQRASQTVLVVTDALTASFNFGSLILTAIILNFRVALLVVAVVILLFFLLRPLARRSRASAQKRTSASVDYAASLTEVVRMTEEIRVFGVEGPQRTIVDARLDRVAVPHFRTQFIGRLLAGVYQTVTVALVLAALAILYLLGVTQIASLGAIVLILVRSLSYAQALQGVYQRMNELSPDLEQVLAERKRYSEGSRTVGTADLAEVASLSFSAVSYEYVASRPALHEVSFRIDHGESIGVVGPSAAGKSTLVQLLLRLRHPTVGTYAVNGLDAGLFSAESWSKQIAYVPQDSRLVHDTVAENIRFFRRDISDSDIERAARMAAIHDEVMQLPGGYLTKVGQRADALSGGQRQRICIARALAARPSLLILDEPTSSLDARSEGLVQRALGQLRGDVTLIIIAHRLSTLNICDKIMVLEEGMLRAFDDRSVLMEREGFFKEALRMSEIR